MNYWALKLPRLTLVGSHLPTIGCNSPPVPGSPEHDGGSAYLTEIDRDNS